jgi:hypothetical protein
VSHFALLLFPTIQNTHGCRIKIDSMWMQMAACACTVYVINYLDRWFIHGSYIITLGIKHGQNIKINSRKTGIITFHQ